MDKFKQVEKHLKGFGSDLQDALYTHLKAMLSLGISPLDSKDYIDSLILDILEELLD